MKSEPMILKPQGDTNVFTAINFFKIGATASAVTSSPLWAPILKRLIAFTPTPPNHHSNKNRKIRTNDPQAAGAIARCFFDFFMDLSAKTPSFESISGRQSSKKALKTLCFR